MSELKGQVGEVQMTVTVTRAATGETETHELIGFVNEEQLQQLQADGLIPTPPQTEEN